MITKMRPKITYLEAKYVEEVTSSMFSLIWFVAVANLGLIT